MQLIFDNIIATMIGGVIMLMMVSVHHRNQISSAEAAGNYALQRQVLDFSRVVQRDMQNLRSVETVHKTDSSLIFWARTSATDTTRRRLEYRRSVSGERGNEMLYKIDRYVDLKWDGGSPHTLSDWKVTPLAENGTPAADPGDVVSLRVVIEAAPPFDMKANESVALRNTRWEATFRPRMLRDKTL